MKFKHKLITYLWTTNKKFMKICAHPRATAPKIRKTELWVPPFKLNMYQPSYTFVARETVILKSLIFSAPFILINAINNDLIASS